MGPINLLFQIVSPRTPSAATDARTYVSPEFTCAAEDNRCFWLDAFSMYKSNDAPAAAALKLPSPTSGRYHALERDTQVAMAEPETSDMQKEHASILVNCRAYFRSHSNCAKGHISLGFSQHSRRDPLVGPDLIHCIAQRSFGVHRKL